MKQGDYRWRVALTAVVGLLVTTSCSRDQSPQIAQSNDTATNAHLGVYAKHLAVTKAVELVASKMPPGDAALFTITNYPVIYKQEDGLFGRQCRRILGETNKDESSRLYALLADAAICQPVSHETLERRSIQIEGLWRDVFLCAFSFGQKGLVIEQNPSLEYWERMFKFLDRVKDEIEDMKTVLDDGSSNRSRRKRQCVRSLAWVLRAKMIRDALYFVDKENGYADLLKDAQRDDILRRLSQYEEYSERTEEEIKKMIHYPTKEELEKKMRENMKRGKFDLING